MFVKSHRDQTSRLEYPGNGNVFFIRFLFSMENYRFVINVFSISLTIRIGFYLDRSRDETHLTFSRLQNRNFFRKID